MLSKVSQDYIDVKYEEAVLEVTTQVTKYVSAVNDSSTDLYQNFNEKLKESFGFNMQQILDTIQTISEELSAAKGQLTVVSNKVESVDINTRKGMSELNDQIEIDRLVSDLVGWVSERQYHL